MFIAPSGLARVAVYIILLTSNDASLLATARPMRPKPTMPTFVPIRPQPKVDIIPHSSRTQRPLK